MLYFTEFIILFLSGFDNVWSYGNSVCLEKTDEFMLNFLTISFRTFVQILLLVLDKVSKLQNIFVINLFLFV